MDFDPELAARRMLISSFAGLALLVSSTGFAPAQASEETIYHFKGAPDGAYPEAELVAGADGALYGTTWGGGLGNGTVFKLTPPASSGGQWTETVLYRFKGGSADGLYPAGSLIFDSQGALYGTTQAGGSRIGSGTNPFKGTVFKLTPPMASNGQWTESVLYSFGAGPSDGTLAAGRLVFDGRGALYGVTAAGGTFGNGTVFKLTPPLFGRGPWTETVLYSFSGAADGRAPNSGLIFDSRGALYGVTAAGAFRA